MKTKLPLLAALLLPLASAQNDLPVVVADSGSQLVDDLVSKLVSRRPAPFWNTDQIPDKLKPDEIMLVGRYATEGVSAAIEKLQEVGPSAFPHLLKHLEDDRYSYSDQPFISGPSGTGWMNHSVGEAVYLVLSNDFSWLGGYKFRNGSDGKMFHPLTFNDYLKVRGGLEQWVAAVKDRSRVEVFMEFVDWCIAEEKKRGFENKEDEGTILARYLSKRKEVEQYGADRMR